MRVAISLGPFRSKNGVTGFPGLKGDEPPEKGRTMYSSTNKQQASSNDPRVILRDGLVVRMSQALAWGEPYVLAPAA